MARTAAEIKATITADFISRAEIIALYNLTAGMTFDQQFSVASVESIIFDVIAAQIAVHEQLVEANATNSKLHTVNWYRQTALNFLDGLPLVWVDDNFGYDLTNVTDVAVRTIVNRCAVLPSNNGQLVIKIATDNAGNLEPLTAAQLVRFTNYMQLVKDAGNFLTIVNQPGDKLKITMTVAVDVSIIDMTTGRLLTTDANIYPVQDAIDKYLAELEFNGAFVRNYFIDEIQKGEGVKDIKINTLQSKFAGFSFTDFDTRKVPNAGYFVYDTADIEINYVKDVLE